MVRFNVPGRIGREWMHKHHLDEDKEFIICMKYVMSVLLYYTGREI